MTYNIKIETGGTGTEAVIGTIPKQIAEYWLMHSKDDAFKEYMTDYDHEGHEEDNNVPEMYRLPYWHDIDNILHTNGIFANGNGGIEVWQNNVRIDSLNGFIQEDMFYENVGEDFPKVSHTDAVFYADTTEKMFCLYEFEIEEPFNKSKLVMGGDMYRGNMVITHAEYDGERIEHNGGEGYTSCLDVMIDYENLIKNE